ncbi:MAG TPA: LLM class flavin-dependent oxidoreductase [Candidatus Tectomicrobia bacterium]|nr:LLM class flavin-dependent oxidoreductase [Candidatus Tectomicrobia bacterium]
MITKFDSLFAGHVDMENVGYDGIAVNDRRFPNEHLATAFDKARVIARTMDRLGYDTFWTAEHHFQPEGYECIPNILMLAVDLAHETKRLKLGCGFNITPMWHPLRLAEDFATADILTGGRVIFGVGRGYHTREVETFGAPLRDQPANRDLFEEQVEIIFKAFNSPSFSHQGTYYTIPPRVPYRGYELQEITLVPQPIHRPIECWQPIQSATPRGLDFMAKHGIKGIIGGGVAEGGAMHNVVAGYRDALRRVGRDPQLGEDLSFGFHFYLANTQEEGVKAAAKYYEENLKMFGPLRLVRALSDEQIEAMADPRRAPHAGLPTLEDAVQKGAFLCGPPELIIEQLLRLEERYPGLERVGVSQPIGTPQAVILEQLEWFAAEVMPAFKKRVQEAVPAN